MPPFVCPPLGHSMNALPGSEYGGKHPLLKQTSCGSAGFQVRSLNL